MSEVALIAVCGNRVATDSDANLSGKSLNVPVVRRAPVSYAAPATCQMSGKRVTASKSRCLDVWRRFQWLWMSHRFVSLGRPRTKSTMWTLLYCACMWDPGSQRQCLWHREWSWCRCSDPDATFMEPTSDKCCECLVRPPTPLGARVRTYPGVCHGPIIIR